ncbi:HAD family hydrolase [Dysosmobacter sp.]|mgnify:FL=1|uniref:HAD family hydrolase n=1 Tax=Dysosmobacter sp. TaxID=2591382 RepID=UPI00307C95BC
MSTEYKRERKEEKPVLAICYDFDKTLSPDDMQAQGFIQSVGYDVETFWKKSNGLASGNDMDQNLAYMLMMQQAAEGKKLFTRGELMKCGKEVVLFPGVKDWFKRICTYGEEHGVLVEHYIISSGLKEMIEGTDVAGEFKKIYASSFFYNEKGVAIWPAQVVNYTNKTQFLFRIEKGVLDINDPGVNDSFAPDEMRVPFRNMVYIGDSDTDVPCMKLVNVNGGYSIGVYNADTKDKTKVYKMMRENRIKYYAPADYSEGKELDILLKAIIDRTAENEALESRFYAYKREQTDADKQTNETEREKVDLLIKLENSRSFATTHAVIEKMRQITVWTKDETENLFTIAVNNSQVFYILGDMDVKAFYQKLLNGCKVPSENAEKIKARIEETDRL